MHRSVHLPSVIPPGLCVEGVVPGDETIVITAKAVSAAAACPLCNVASRRIHSRYVGMFRIFLVPAEVRAFALSHVGSTARCLTADGRSSQSASTIRCSAPVLGERAGSTALSIISDWRLAADQGQASRRG